MTREQVVALLHKATFPNAFRWARERQISPSVVSECLNGDKAIPPQVCAALGIERVTTYRKIKTPKET